MSYEFIKSGSTLLNCSLNGGYPLGHISSISGLHSTGKTQLAIEIAANFARTYPKGKLFYLDSECAFDPDYAAILGLPRDKVEFVEDAPSFETFDRNLTKTLKSLGPDEPAVYFLDSFDALPEDEELVEPKADKKDDDDSTPSKGKKSKGGYGLGRQKKLSGLLRKTVGLISEKRAHLNIITQLRTNLDPFDPNKWSETGGQALQFYASQRIRMGHIGKIHQVINGKKWPTGVSVSAEIKKNKVGRPFLKCGFDILFDYGIDDFTSCMEWLQEHGLMEQVPGMEKYKTINGFAGSLDKMSKDQFAESVRKVQEFTESEFYRIQAMFKPKRSKYDSLFEEPKTETDLLIDDKETVQAKDVINKKANEAKELINKKVAK